MKQIIGFCQFCDGFPDSRKEQFSYEGKKALFDYLEQLEEDMGQEIEFDPIALCCEYTEYKDIDEFQEAYSGDYETMDDISKRTCIIMIDDESFLMQDF